MKAHNAEVVANQHGDHHLTPGTVFIIGSQVDEVEKVVHLNISTPHMLLHTIRALPFAVTPGRSTRMAPSSAPFLLMRASSSTPARDKAATVAPATRRAAKAAPQAALPKRRAAELLPLNEARGSPVSGLPRLAKAMPGLVPPPPPPPQRQPLPLRLEVATSLQISFFHSSALPVVVMGSISTGQGGR